MAVAVVVDRQIVKHPIFEAAAVAAAAWAVFASEMMEMR